MSELTELTDEQLINLVKQVTGWTVHCQTQREPHGYFYIGHHPRAPVPEMLRLARSILASRPAVADQANDDHPVEAWQWRKKNQSWSLDRTFNSEPFARTEGSEVRALYVHPAPQTVAEHKSFYEAWEATCTHDHGEYDENAPIAARLRWWLPKSARHGMLTIEHDLHEGAEALDRVAHPAPQAVTRDDVLDEIDEHLNAWSGKLDKASFRKFIRALKSQSQTGGEG